MKPLVTVRDPQTIAKLHVDALLADSPRWREAATGTHLPSRDGTAPGVFVPLVVTRLDGWDAVQWPVKSFARIRVVVWSYDEDNAYDLAAWLMGRLLASPGDPDTAGYLFNTGPAREVDPDFDSPISAFTIIQKVKPQIIVIDPSNTDA